MCASHTGGVAAPDESPKPLDRSQFNAAGSYVSCWPLEVSYVDLLVLLALGIGDLQYSFRSAAGAATGWLVDPPADAQWQRIKCFVVRTPFGSCWPGGGAITCSASWRAIDARRHRGRRP